MANQQHTHQPTQKSETVHQTTVSCDGGGGALGHPNVFLEITANGDVTCPYCSKHFVLSADAANTPQAH